MEPWEKDLEEAHGREGRHALNDFFASSEGVRLLQRAVEEGSYETTCPEESALLVIAYFLSCGKNVEAESILKSIQPYFSRLRFYPRLTNKAVLTENSSVQLPQAAGTIQVQVAPVEAVVASLERRARKTTVIDEKLDDALEAQEFRSMYDAAVSLVNETVAGGEVPVATLDRATAKNVVVGGWPCQVYTVPGWKERCDALLAKYEAATAAREERKKKAVLSRTPPPSTSRRWRPRRGREEEGDVEEKKPRATNRSRVMELLRVMRDNPKALTGRQVAFLRVMVATHNGASKRFPTTISTLGSAALCNVVLSRYRVCGSLDKSIGPITEADSVSSSCPVGFPLPASIRRKVTRGIKSSIPSLVEARALTSGEVLARVLPQASASALTSHLSDARVKLLFEGLYLAFRRRRSLLLLNLEQQVKLEELPWAAALCQLVNAGGAQETSKAVLVTVSRISLESWPQTILPNKLLQEFKAFAAASGLTQEKNVDESRLVILEELAADIFQGTFAPKWLRAAQICRSRLPSTSLYCTYFGIAWEKLDKSSFDDVMNEYVKSRLTYSDGSPKSGYVAQQGMLVESAMIWTTHNVLPLIVACEVAFDDATLLRMAEKAFKWIIKKLEHPELCSKWTLRLARAKNAAYAWRQMILFLSLVSNPSLIAEQFWPRAQSLFSRSHDQGFRTRFAPAVAGLGKHILPNGGGDEGRLFSGWAPIWNHWVLPPSTWVRQARERYVPTEPEAWEGAGNADDGEYVDAGDGGDWGNAGGDWAPPE